MSSPLRLAVAVSTVALGLLSVTTPATGASGPPAHLVIVQAVPHDAIDVSVDGRSIRSDSTVGSVLGPISVSPGRHQVRFTDAAVGLSLTSTVVVRSGSSSDIVVHLPAQLNGAPVVNSYRTPRSPIAPGKARVLIAHTATVAPADVRVDGKVVFHDIANGEYATADLAAGHHSVALLPAGLSGPPILGPIPVDLKAGTVTMVYAVGNPRDRSMKVIAHTATLSSNGAVVPASIDTGQADLAAGLTVHPFAAPPPTGGAPRPGDLSTSEILVAGGIVLLSIGLGQRLLRRRTRSRPLRLR
jgi:Domain of unknown function (DUF4397)